MLDSCFIVAENIRVAKDVYKMTLFGETSNITAPGQFVNIKIDGFFLRRPMSVCNYDTTTFTVIYKVVGEGTKALSKIQRGTELEILTGLGNGFSTLASGERPVLIGGGSGLPPLYQLCLNLRAEGKKPIVVMGFRSEEDMFYVDEFAKIAYEVQVATEDGSFGESGLVTDVLKNIEGYTYVYACGPIPMLKAVSRVSSADGQFSFEERMGCGFGACMGCSCKTNFGNKRICKDGPVFKKEEILWETLR